MARIDKRALTKLEIVQEASKQFLEKGYTSTTISAISKELDMSPGNLTFHFPTKEHLLAELVELLCSFQWNMMEKEADEGYSSVMAICLETASMASACENDNVIKDFFISAYCSPLCLEIIRKNDVKQAKKVFGEYRSEWTDEQFEEAGILCSGIEYATLMTAGNTVSLETRISGALNSILAIYGIPEETRKIKNQKVFAIDYRNLGKRVLSEFKEYVEKANEQALQDLLKW
ncbi:MAG: TetR/AcrR family transcriptional regulator [Oscillospiraceae bacterium]|nr:TetR/AcrR family transcriptional regulator [Oscillospiraceae bacterium]MBR3952515.1 TetR/AcrR family transcriptional regulator [Oscillospiraceae bacterium]